MNNGTETPTTNGFWFWFISGEFFASLSLIFPSRVVGVEFSVQAREFHATFNKNLSILSLKQIGI